MVLFDPVIQVLALANPDRLQPAPGAILQAVCGVARNDRLVVSLATIDDDAIRSAMTLGGFSEEALCCEEAAVKIHPLAADLDVGFVDMPFAGHATLAPVEMLQQERCETYGSAVNGRVVDGDPPLGHHFFQITQTQAVSQIPSHAQQDH